jgi:hypothetical protein
VLGFGPVLGFMSGNLVVTPLFVVCRSPYASGVRDLRARMRVSRARER